ncbi:TetR/AcrR family transcriptional regulator [Hominifimenecus sp. rT4P-3]|uniref:TetR/AcrR family transcriptional regulator n=1 Tax=Hominifimenecus sp. rT4P-3 TaxID=3242979 RepID=UPI003DA5DE66
MPKQKITKEMVVHAAFELARSSGMEQVMVKNIADKIGCSVQPIYSYCKNMEGLRQDVVEQVNRFIQEYIANHLDKEDLFRSTGMAYIQLAEEEPHLFKIFILHQRTGIASLDDLYRAETNSRMAEFISEKWNISLSQARKLHLNMLIYTIGIGTIFSVTTPGISADEIYEHQEMAYRAFLSQATKGEE